MQNRTAIVSSACLKLLSVFCSWLNTCKTGRCQLKSGANSQLDRSPLCSNMYMYNISYYYHMQMQHGSASGHVCLFIIIIYWIFAAKGWISSTLYNKQVSINTKITQIQNYHYIHRGPIKTSTFLFCSSFYKC